MIHPLRHAICPALAVLALAACGGNSSGGSAPSSPPAPPSAAPVATTVITITASGVTPKNVIVPLGSQITFANNDTITHLMFSDPHPEHTDCPDINQVGYLEPGQSRQTGNMNVVRTCGFHDHNLPSATTLQGTITTR